jgi:DegV family protein with EDD domain
VRIVIDDAGDVPAELVKELGIVVVPINITFGTEEYMTGINMDHAGFYAKVKEVGDHNFPKSSQPTPFQFAEYYREILASDEKEILTITVGKKLSGTYDSAEAAANDLADQGTFYLFDSAGGSAAQGYMAIEAARMAQAGTSIDEIMKRMEEMRENQCVVFLVDSLEYAVKGGRVGSLQSTMASLLRIKPIMQVNDGLIVEAGKVRTYSKALDYIVDFVFQQVGEQPIKLAIIHAGSPEGAMTLQEMAKSRLNYTEEFIADMGISVAINLGPGALGIVAIPE